VDHIGGHNVLEPCLYGTPVIFGPYTQGQNEFARRVIDAGAGMRVSLEELNQKVEAFFQDPVQEKRMKSAALNVVESNRGSTLKTLNILYPPSKVL